MTKALAILSFVLISIGLISCNENPNLEPINKTFMDLNVIAGNSDSCEYYEYNPEYISYPTDSLLGRSFIKDLIDLDNDNTYDIAIEREILNDPYEIYSYQYLSIEGMNNMTVFNNPPTLFNSNHALAFSKGQKIGEHGAWVETGYLILTWETKEGESTQHDTSGLWTERNKTQYLGISRTYPDTLIGWVGIEITSDDLIIIKECAIKRN